MIDYKIVLRKILTKQMEEVIESAKTQIWGIK